MWSGFNMFRNFVVNLIFIFVGVCITVTIVTIIEKCFTYQKYRYTLMERQTIAIEQINQKLNDVKVQISIKQEEIAKWQYTIEETKVPDVYKVYYQQSREGEIFEIQRGK